MIYLNILKSILICNLLCCLIASAWLWGIEDNFLGRYLVSLLYSYVIFGITGSVLWFTLYHFASKLIHKKALRHITSCVLSSVIAGPLFYLVIGEPGGALEIFEYWIFTLPTGILCSAFYVYRYLRYEVQTN